MVFCRFNLLAALLGVLVLASPVRAQQTSLPAEVALGNVDAPVTLIVYASINCRHCRAFHEAVWPQLRSNYVDRGLVRFVLREVSIIPPGISGAAFQLARCGGADEEVYFQRVTAIYAQGDALVQYEPLIVSPSGKVISGGGLDMTAMRQLGVSFGLTPTQVESRIQDDRAGVERGERLLREGGRQFHITGVPTLILNGQMLDSRDDTIVTFAGLSRLIDERLAETDRAE